MFVSTYGKSVFRFYLEHYEHKDDFLFLEKVPTQYGHWKDKEKVFMTFIKVHQPSSFAVLFSHFKEVDKQRVLKQLSQYGKLKSTQEKDGTFYGFIETKD